MPPVSFRIQGSQNTLIINEKNMATIKSPTAKQSFLLVRELKRGIVSLYANSLPLLGRGFLLVLATVPAYMSAQRLTAKNEIIECGSVMYNQPVSVKFEMHNKGGNFIIREVKTGCGCTSVEYPKGVIPAGDSFTVTATYDARQMGHFDKDVAIYSNAWDKPYYLKMRGVVVEEVIAFSGDYPFKLDMLKADKNDLEFDDVNRGDHPMQKINIMNVSSTPLSPVVMHLPNYLKATVAPTTIAPGRQGTVSIMLDSKKLRDYGLSQTSVYLGMFPGDKVGQDKEITVSAVLLPSFSEMTESELANAPQIRLSHESLDLGSFNGKKKKSGTIIIENVGRSELDISSLQMFTDGLGVKLNKTRLAPGEQAKLKIKAEARMLRKVRGKPRVLMITNDPLKPKVVININAGL